MSIFIQGLLLQASLILALGAQNIFVLESGLKRQRHLLVATVCSICDVILIFIGVVGAARFFIQVPQLKFIFGVLGIGFLFYYGVKKLFEFFSKDAVETIKNPGTDNTESIGKIIFSTLGFSLLNPHVYLDTVILIGGFATQFANANDRLQFGAGASAFSIVWFFSLAFFASLLGPYLRSAKNMKRVSLVSGLILIVLALKLGFDLSRWSSTF